MCQGRTGNCPSLDPVDSYLVSQGSHPFFLPETVGSYTILLEKEAPVTAVEREIAVDDGRQITVFCLGKKKLEEERQKLLLVHSGFRTRNYVCFHSFPVQEMDIKIR